MSRCFLAVLVIVVVSHYEAFSLPLGGKGNPQLMMKILEDIPWTEITSAITPELWDLTGKILDDVSHIEGVTALADLYKGQAFDPQLLAKILSNIPWLKLSSAITPEIWKIYGKILDGLPWLQTGDAVGEIFPGTNFNPQLLAKIFDNINWSELTSAITPELWVLTGKILDDLPWDEEVNELKEIYEGKDFNPQLLAKILNKIPFSEYARSISPELWGIIGKILDEIPWLESGDAIAKLYGGDMFQPKLLAKIYDKIPWSEVTSAITPELWELTGEILDDLPWGEGFDAIKKLYAGETFDPELLVNILNKIPFSKLSSAITPEFSAVTGKILDNFPWLEVGDDIAKLYKGTMLKPQLVAKVADKIPWLKLTSAITPELWELTGRILDDLPWDEGIKEIKGLYEGKEFNPKLLAEILNKIPWTEYTHAISPELWAITGSILDDLPWEEEVNAIAELYGGKMLNPQLLSKVLGNMPWSELTSAITPELWEITGRILDDFPWAEELEELKGLYEGKEFNPQLLAKILDKFPWTEYNAAVTPELWELGGRILDDFPWEETVNAISELTGMKLFLPHILAKVLDDIPWSELTAAITPEYRAIVARILEDLPFVGSVNAIKDLQEGKFNPELMAKFLDNIPWSEMMSAQTPELWAIVGKILDDFPWEEEINAIAKLYKGKMFNPQLLANILDNIPWSDLISATTPELRALIGRILDDLPWVESVNALADIHNGKRFNPLLLARVLDNLPWSELIAATSRDLFTVIGRIADDLPRVEIINAIAELLET